MTNDHRTTLEEVRCAAWALCDDTEGTVYTDEFGEYYRVPKSAWDRLAAAVAASEQQPANQLERWSFKFGRRVTEFAVPGVTKEGVHSIRVTFEDGSKLEVQHSNIDGVWTALHNAAAEYSAASPGLGGRGKDA